ncbi:EF-hand domain-containing protein [Luteimonas viscosa]|nr:EF-hand domain-containing protein [Luteimonas viscosa]
MKHKTLFTALALALAMSAGAMAAEPAASPQRADKPALDTNGDGVVDRAEASKYPRLAAKFDTLDANSDGRLDASERPQRRHHGHGGMGSRSHGGHHGAERLDADGDGRLSREEVAAARAGRDGRPDRLGEHFDAIDANSDGYIVRNELRAWHETQRPLRQAEMRKRFDERFTTADLNGDGKLSRVEVDEKMPRLAKRFAWMDDNRDGFLSRAELQPPQRR